MGSKRIWKVSINPKQFPREGLWPILREHELIAIGWPERRPEVERIRDVKDFHSIRPGDVIIAYGGGYTIKAVGIATSTPKFYEKGISRYFAGRLNRIGDVDWLIIRDLNTEDLPIPSKSRPGLSWRDTVHDLTPEEWEETKRFLKIDI